MEELSQVADRSGWRRPSQSQDRAGTAPIQVPVPDRDPNAFAPVFVLAPARSHSSVVTTAIGQHPQLHGFPELGLYRRDTIRPILFDPPGWKGIPSGARRGGLLRALAQQNDGDQGPKAILEAYDWLRCRRDWSGAHVYDHLLSRRGSEDRRGEDAGQLEQRAEPCPIGRGLPSCPLSSPHSTPRHGAALDVRSLVPIAVVERAAGPVPPVLHGGLALPP